MTVKEPYLSIHQFRSSGKSLLLKHLEGDGKIAKQPVPKFIEMKGCINCEVSKSHKERHGTDYGFDHELIVCCLIAGCMDYGYNLGTPFLDPDEAIRFAKEKGNPNLIQKAEKYANKIRERFKNFYQEEA